MTLSLQSYLNAVVKWSQLTWKGLSEISSSEVTEKETTSSSSSTTTNTTNTTNIIASNKRKRQPDCLDNISDQKVVDLVAFLKYVHEPLKNVNQSFPSTSNYGVAILSDGNHSEILLKLWNDFSSMHSINHFKKYIGQMFEFKNVTSKHCKLKND